MYKIKLNGRIVELVYREDFIDDAGWTVVEVASTDQEYSDALTLYTQLNASGNIVLWNAETGTMFAATESDPELIQKKREDKLNALRLMRKPRLEEADVLVNRAHDNNADPSSLKVYREALRHVTDPYKDHKIDSAHAALLDAIIDNWSSFEWPVKPT